jgi:lipoprotein-releasing system permease protein
MLAIAAGTCALIIVLSVFNGFSNFIEQLYNSFYTDVVIVSERGKFYEMNPELEKAIVSYPYIKGYSFSLEDQAMAQSENAQKIIQLKGVDQKFAKLTGLNQYIKYGDSNIHNGQPVMIAGIGVANTLGIDERNITPVKIFALHQDADLITAPQSAYTELPLYLTGIFVLQDELDNEFCITTLDKVQEVLELPEQISHTHINLASDRQARQMIQSLQPLLKKYKLKAMTKQEQNKTLYSILNSEKWMSYAVLCFILFIAAFNIVACMSMMVIEKRKDIKTLKALGADDGLIQKIFLNAGASIGLVGALIGIAVALIVILTQIYFPWLKIGNGEGLLLTYYPVAIQFTDFILVLITVLVLSILASWIPARKSISY